MKRRLLYLFAAALLCNNTKAQTVIFSQNFNDASTAIGSGANQLDGIGATATTPANNTASTTITDGKLKITRTETGSSKGVAWAVRTTTLAPATQLFKIEFKLKVTAQSANQSAVQLLFGNSFTDDKGNNTGGTIMNGRIGIDPANPEGFKIRDPEQNQGSAVFNGEQTVTIFYNATNVEQEYKRLDNAETESINADSWIAWVGTTQILINGVANVPVNNAGVTINNFKIWNSQGVDATFLFDDFVVTSLELTNTPTTTPVALTYFKGKWENGFAQLNWQTVSEQNNSHFDILRSADGKSFAKIGTESGHGTSQSVNNYSFTDNAALPGANYYILRQVDLNGDSKEYTPVLIENPLQQQLFSINASGDRLSLQVSAPSAGVATLNILDTQGRKIAEHKLHLEEGTNQLTLPFGSVPAGIYVGAITSNAGVQRIKFIYQ